MKIKNLFFVSLAALSLAACSNDEEVNVPQEGSVVINLTSADQKTKTVVGYDEENAMAGNVYAYLGNTLVETKAFSTEDSAIKFEKLTEGQTYQFVAVANSDKTATTVDGFKTIEIEAPTAKENFVMYEVTSATIAAAQEQDITMTVKRVLSAVQLGTVTRAQTGKIPSSLSNATMQIESLTLYNVNPSVQLNGVKINGTKENATELAATFADKTVVNNSSVSINGTTVTERAYACPTEGAENLYAVLTVKYKGAGENGADVTKHFNIVLSDGLEANTLYALNVTITGVGSDGGGIPDEFGDAAGALTPQPWSEGSVINVNNQEN